MLCSEAFPILVQKGITALYHANTVTTSRAFIRMGGLASRARVEKERLPQTSQYTDAIDKHYGIWNDIFTDSVDIHARTQSPNQYGPVMFVLDTHILLDQPNDIEVHFTRSNPTKWAQNQTYEDRYFATPADLTAGLVKGTFDHMITFKTPSGFIPFATRLRQIVVDDPGLEWLPSHENVHASAMAALQASAPAIQLSGLQRRRCIGRCKCVERYADRSADIPRLFGVQ